MHIVTGKPDGFDAPITVYLEVWEKTGMQEMALGLAMSVRVNWLTSSVIPFSLLVKTT